MAADFEVRDSTVVWDGILSTARVDRLVMPDGDTAEREVVSHIDAVAVVPLTPDDDVVLLRQYRHPVGGYQLELPAGILDEPDEAPEEAARRELAEETGMGVGELVPLVRFANSAGWTDEHTTVFWGRDVVPASRPDGFEATAEEADMQVVTLPWSEALARARRGELTDAKTLIGILAVAARRAAADVA